MQEWTIISGVELDMNIKG